MAVESQHVVVDVVEVQEYPDLARTYAIRGVPKTVINDTVEFTGAVSEEGFLEHVLRAAGEDVPEEGAAGQDSERITPLA